MDGSFIHRFIVVYIGNYQRMKRRYACVSTVHRASVMLANVFKFRFTIARFLVVWVVRAERARGVFMRRASAGFFVPRELRYNTSMEDWFTIVTYTSSLINLLISGNYRNKDE